MLARAIASNRVGPESRAGKAMSRSGTWRLSHEPKWSNISATEGTQLMNGSIGIAAFAAYAVVAYLALYVVASRGAATALMGALMLSSIFGTMVYFIAGFPPEWAVAFAAVTAVYLWLSTMLLRRARDAWRRAPNVSSGRARR